MKYKLDYYPDPGIALDISRILFIKLNPPIIWHSTLTSLDSRDEEISYIQKQADSFPSAPPELLLLSFLPNNKESTLLSTIISRLIYHNFVDFSVSDISRYFSNTKQIQRDIFTYYLGTHPLASTDLERAIRLNKNIPDRLKLLLFSFLLNPLSYITSLCDILDQYYRIITELWFSNPEPPVIPDAFIDHILEKTNTLSDSEVLSFHSHPLPFSLCYSTSLFLFKNFTKESPFFITTNNTVSHMVDPIETSKPSSLIDSASALSDKNRIAIIDYIVSHPNTSLNQLVQALDIPHSTVTHHISLLKKAHVISLTRSGHSVSYSYNPQGFQNIIDALKKIENKGNNR